MEGICGKDRGLCTWKEQLNCAGCREDMGKPFSGPCGISACCRRGMSAAKPAPTVPSAPAGPAGTTSPGRSSSAGTARRRSAVWRKLWKLLLSSLGTLVLLVFSVFMGPFIIVLAALATVGLMIY